MKKQANIVYIRADDMGYGDVSCLNAELARLTAAEHGDSSADVFATADEARRGDGLFDAPPDCQRIGFMGLSPVKYLFVVCNK